MQHAAAFHTQSKNTQVKHMQNTVTAFMDPSLADLTAENKHKQYKLCNITFWLLFIFTNLHFSSICFILMFLPRGGGGYFELQESAMVFSVFF